MYAYRTLLEQKIRERRQTFDEFVEYAETFARDHGEPGTLSVRHLQRLAAGRRSDGQPLGRLQPATARLLEHIFGVGIGELLAPPSGGEAANNSIAEIRAKLHISRRVDMATVELLRNQLSTIRRLDRQLGAVVAHDEVLTKVNQVASLFIHSLTGNVREQLAALLSELLCLAGWQSLDLGNVSKAWRYYGEARAVALQTPDLAYLALADAGRGFVLSDAGEAASAVGVLTEVSERLRPNCSPLVRSWLAAAHGEALASNGERTRSLQAFDQANEHLPTNSALPDGPYVALDQVHLARWRGNALAQFGIPEAVDVLRTALDNLDPTFIRAKTSLHVDLAAAFVALDEAELAHTEANRADRLAARIGSVRQQRRTKVLLASLPSSTTQLDPPLGMQNRAL